MDRKLLGVGRTAEVFEEDENTVLKLFYAHMPLDLAEREYRISTAVYQLGLPTPKPIDLFDLNGRQGIRYERVQGATMLQLIGQKPWRFIREAWRLSELHHEILKLKVNSQSLGLPRLKDEWTARIAGAPLLKDGEKQDILSRFTQMQDEDRLCHGDLHPDNVMIGDQIWIMDWMTGMIGNPVADAARTALMLRAGELPPNTSKLKVVIIKFMQEWMYRTYVRHYLNLTGRTWNELDAWMLYAAAARLVEPISDQEKRQLVHFIRTKI